ncbi:hypothetical protein [Nakamurella sp.]|uniref:hypothetical protein n=1 Tax=Nakamurella sp. TaxID=1869182 RepID=UPI003B3A3A01
MALGALMLSAVGVAACGTPTAGSATANPSAAIPSPSPSASASRPSAVVTTLTVTAVTTASAPPATDLTGEQYGFITAVDVAAGTVSLDRIAYFTGADAQKACAEDGVTDTSNNWCTGYYWRNNNPALRTLAVSPDATITVLDGSASVPGSLEKVAQRITQATSTYRLVITDGRVTEMHEMYAP